MLFAETSTAVQIAEIVVPVVGTAFSAWIVLQLAKVKEKQTEAALALETLKANQKAAADRHEETAVKVDRVLSTVGTVKKLVDGSLGTSLDLTAAASRRAADATGEEADRQAAELAEKAARDHATTEAKG
jgi:hypothetical protein